MNGVWPLTLREAAVRLTDVATEQRHDRVRERHLGRGVEYGLGREAAGDHQQRHVAHDLRRRRHLDDVAEHLVDLRVGASDLVPARIADAERTGLLAMVGKAERGPAAIESIRRHGAAYLMAVGGAAYLVSKAVRAARVVAFSDLGMEAIYEFVVKDMPVTVAVDARGQSVHQAGPEEWRRKIVEFKLPVTAA